MSEFKLIEAAGAHPKVVGLAYSGGKMTLGGWKYPVVVDLAGLDLPDAVPLLTNHENRTDCRIGMVTAAVRDGALEISGEILSGNDAAKDIVSQAKAGAAWQLSIGADVKECELVKSTRDVNGQSHDGPFYHVQKSVLREVSVVAVGADGSTVMKIAAKFNLQGEEMSEEKKTLEAAAPAVEKQPEIKAEIDVTAAVTAAVEEAVKAERKRTSEIKEICGGEFADIEAKALAENWDVDQTRKEVLAAYRKQKPASSVNVIIAERSTDQNTLEAALGFRVGLSEDALIKANGEKAVEAGASMMDMSLGQLMVECCRLEGKSVSGRHDQDTIRAAFSTVALPSVLGNVANRKLLQAFEAQPVAALKLGRTGDLNDFKESQRIRITDLGGMEAVGNDGNLKHGAIGEEVAVNQLETYGKAFCLTRKMIINDDIGAFMQVPTAMGNRAARLIDQLLFARLLANPVQGDGTALFAAGHKNLLSGNTSALSKESLEKALALFLNQTDADGNPIAVEAKYLVVPPALKYTAMELVKGATLIPGADGALRPAMNAIVQDNLEVIASPYLSNAKIAGNSESSWYLFGNPAQTDTFEIGYLKGKRTPTIERGETDFNTLGQWFRIYFDLGVRELGHRGMVKSVGA